VVNSTTYYGGYGHPTSLGRIAHNGMATIPADWTNEEIAKGFPEMTDTAIAVRDLRINCDSAIDSWHTNPISQHVIELVVGLCQTMKQRFMFVLGALERFRDGQRTGVKHPIIEGFMEKNQVRLEFLILQFETVKRDYELVDIVNCCEATGKAWHTVIRELDDINDMFEEWESMAELEAEKKLEASDQFKDGLDYSY